MVVIFNEVQNKINQKQVQQTCLAQCTTAQAKKTQQSTKDKRYRQDAVANVQYVRLFLQPEISIDGKSEILQGAT